MFFGDFKYSVPISTIIERDSKGRILFEFTCDSVHKNFSSNPRNTVIVICQKNDREYTYFYEDICYTFELNDSTALETLKEQNDWNKELDESKMSRRQAQVSFDRAIINESSKNYRFYDFKDEVLDDVGIEDKYCDMWIIDTDETGKDLFCLNIFSDETRAQLESRYFVLRKSDDEFAYAKTDHEVFNKEDLIKLKKENGWKYGF